MYWYPLAYRKSATESAWEGRLIMLQNASSTVCVSTGHQRHPVGTLAQRLFDQARCCEFTVSHFLTTGRETYRHDYPY